MSLPYRWACQLADGRLIHEVTDEHPNGQGIKPYLEDETLTAIHLLPQEEGFPILCLKVQEDPSFRPIFFRRNFKQLNAETLEELNHVHVTVLCWQRTIAGKNVKSFTVVYPDGSVLVTDDNEAF